MKIITRGIIDWATGRILEQDSFEYSGQVSEAKSSGSAPQPVDPYQQAAAQYGLATGTAEFNAGLNRTNSSNPLGSSTWSVDGYSGQPGTQQQPTVNYNPNGNTSFGLGGSGVPISSGTPPATATVGQGMPTNPNGSFGLPTGPPPTANYGGGYGNYTQGGRYGSGSTRTGTGAPLYTQTTTLAPWAQNELQQPLNTSGLPGMPGGPSIQQNLADTQNAIYGQQMGYIQPQEQLANEQLQSQLANEGATPGSEAYNNAVAAQGRANTFTNQQAINQAITGGEQEQANLFGLGTGALQNQITARNVPINEFNALQGGAGATATAQTPDISGAFGQQYQGKLAGYNANTATNNANTQAAEEAAAMAAIYFF